MPRPRRDPREEPPMQQWTAEALRGREEDERQLHGVYVDGVQTDGERAAANRAMIARMRAAEGPALAERRAAQAQRNGEVWSRVGAAERSRRLTDESLRAWARLRATWGVLPPTDMPEEG